MHVRSGLGGARRIRVFEVGESGFDQRSGVEIAEIAHEHERHGIGSIPRLVERTQRFRREGVAIFLGADRPARGEPSARVQDVVNPHPNAQPGRVALAILGVDNALLRVDLLALQQKPSREVAQHGQPFAHGFRVGGRQVELIDRLAHARHRIGVRAEVHALRLEPLDERAGREVLAAVERHVLEEVSHALLVVALGEAPHVDVQAQVAALLGLFVRFPREAHPVLEVPEVQVRVGR